MDVRARIHARSHDIEQLLTTRRSRFIGSSWTVLLALGGAPHMALAHEPAPPPDPPVERVETQTAAELPVSTRPTVSPTFQLVVGPPLARSMGVRVTVRRTGDGLLIVHELPRPASADDDAPPLSFQLPPGEYMLEAEAPGYLPSTRAVTVGTEGVAEAIAWDLLPDNSYRTVRFPLVSAAGGGFLSISARHFASEQPPVRCTARATVCELRLRPGNWELEASAPGHHPLRRVIDVGDAEPQNVDLSLEPDVLEPPRPDLAAANRAPAPLLGLTFVSFPLFVAGLSMTIPGAVRYRSHRDGPDCASHGAECAEAITPRIHTTAAGAGLLGAGFGVVAAGITGTRARGTTAWWVELGLGSALAVGGAGWLIGNSILLHRELESGPLADIDARALRRPFSSFVLGAGLGLVGGSMTALLVRRRKAARAAHIAPYGGPGQAGLSLTGRF